MKITVQILQSERFPSYINIDVNGIRIGPATLGQWRVTHTFATDMDDAEIRADERAKALREAAKSIRGFAFFPDDLMRISVVESLLLAMAEKGTP